MVVGAQMAVEYINADPSILEDYEITMLIRDTQCKADIVMKQFMHFIVNETHPIAGIVGKYFKPHLLQLTFSLTKVLCNFILGFSTQEH